MQLQPITIAALSLLAMSAAAGLGMLLRKVLPDHHKDDKSLDAVIRAIGLVVTLTALVLGFFVNSAKSYYDGLSGDLRELGADLGAVDRTLERYGPVAAPLRDELRVCGGIAVRIMWPDHATGLPDARKTPRQCLEDLQDGMHALPADDPRQQRLRDQAIQVAATIERQSLLLGEMSTSHMQMPLLVVLVAWLSTIYLGFGLVWPRSGTAIVSLALSATVCAGAILMILELYAPLSGLISIDPAVIEVPLRPTAIVDAPPPLR
ncbi:MAG: hypothetical protein U1F08_10885 [Steroidobacteraceae bacterium]